MQKAAALGGRLGDVAFVDGVAVVESAAEHSFIVSNEGEREGLHALGQVAECEQLRIADGLGPSGVALRWRTAGTGNHLK